MRMWNVDPSKMCDQHLLGEHLECHMFVGSINKGTSIQGFIDNGLLDLGTLRQRHDILVAEMLRRGMNHSSPLKPFEIPVHAATNMVSSEANVAELIKRCPKCRILLQG